MTPRPAPDVDGFLQAYRDATHAVPFSAAMRAWAIPGRSIVVTEIQHTPYQAEPIWLKSIMIPDQQRGGHASHVLRAVTGLADRFGVAIWLVPKPFGVTSQPLDVESLEAWYARNGWKRPKRGSVWVRLPKTRSATKPNPRIPHWDQVSDAEKRRLCSIFENKDRHPAAWAALPSIEKHKARKAYHDLVALPSRAQREADPQWRDRVLAVRVAREQEEARQDAMRAALRRLGSARIAAMVRVRVGVRMEGTVRPFPKSSYLRVRSPDGDGDITLRISDHESPAEGGYRERNGEMGRFGAADVHIDPAQPEATVIAQVERAVREIRSAIADLTPRDNPVAMDDRVTLAIYAALARQSKQAGKAARLEAGDIREAMVRWVKRKPQIRTLVPILDRMVARGLLTVHEVSRVGTRYVGAGGAANFDPTPRPDYKRDRYYQMTPAGFADARRLAALHGTPKANPAGRLPPITPGNLGGPGYTAKSARARHAILRESVAEEGYRSTLGKILLLERYGARTMHRDTLRLLARDRAWLRETFGGPGSFAT